MRMTSRHLATLMLGVSLLASTGCKKKKTDEDDTIVDSVPAVDEALSVTSLSPSQVEPNTPTKAVLYGAGFTATPEVSINGFLAEDVSARTENVVDLTLPGLPLGTYDVEVTLPTGETATLRGGLRVEEAEVRCEAAKAHFAFDSDAITSDSAAALRAQVDCWLQSDVTLRIEGHCDERGTIEYNLALGDRRANAVAGWLQAQGIPASRIKAVSYGEERPVDPGHDEAAWAKNRRAEVLPQH